MNFIKSIAAGAAFGGALFFTAGVANAQPMETADPDGLVGITVSDVTILEAVPVDAAATIAGTLCASAPEDVNALALQVDNEGVNQTVCEGLPGGDLLLTQNVSSPESEPEAAETGTPETTTAPSDGG
ncbi:MAG: hypothetical protein WBB00_14045 [Mycobacterium sp.]